MITWHATPSFVVQAGYEIVYGMYPFGHTQLHLLPLADVMWASD